MSAEESLAEVRDILHYRFEGTGTYCRWESVALCPAYHQATEAARALLASPVLQELREQDRAEGWDDCAKNHAAMGFIRHALAMNPYRRTEPTT